MARPSSCRPCRTTPPHLPPLVRRLAAFAFATAALSAGPAWAQGVVVGSIAAGAGEQAVVPLAFAGTGVAHLQLDVEFDPAVLTPSAVSAGDALGGELVDWAVVSPGVLRVVVSTRSCPAPPASPARQGAAATLGEGEVVRIAWQVDAAAPPGVYALEPSGAVLSDEAGGAVAVSLAPGSIEVTAAAAPAEIPALGEWGIAGLVVLLFGAGLWVLRRGSAAGIVAALIWLLAVQPMLAQMPRRGAVEPQVDALPPLPGPRLDRLVAAAVGGPGDADADGDVTASDLAPILGQILRRENAPGDPDCNGDGEVDVLDLACVLASVCADGAPDNLPPVLSPIGDATLREGEVLAFQASASDPDPGDELTFALLGAPVGMVVDRTDGSVLWAPRGNQAGAATPRLRVTDSGGLFAERAFTVTVRALGAPPSLAALADREVLVGTSLAATAAATDPDLPDDQLTFSLPAPPAGMAIDPASGAISWTPAADQVGAHDVTVEVADREGLLDFTHFIATVQVANRPPVARDEAYEARIGVPLTIAAPGLLGNDEDPDGDPLTAALGDDAVKGTLSLAADGGFTYLLEPADRTTTVDLELQCAATRGPSRFQTNGTVAAGDVDGDGDVELVGAAGLSGRSFVSEIWILNAADCSEQAATGASVEDAGGFNGASHLGLLDIDGDGDLEIIGTRERYPFAEGGAADGQHLIAVHYDGTLAWPGNGGSEDTSIPTNAFLNWQDAGPTFADLDADGTAEIVMAFTTGFGFNTFAGAVAWNAADGSLEWEFFSDFRQGDHNLVKVPHIADLDLDGKLEVIVHNSVLDHRGELLFELPSFEASGTTVGSHLALAIANFDDDPFPELFGRDNRFHSLYEHDGTLAWQREAPNSAGNQVTAADLDGDGAVELAYVTRVPGSASYFVAAYDTDGSLLWSHQGEAGLSIDALFAARSNLTAFDANRDGAFDLVMRNDSQDLLLIVDGRDGSVLESVPADDFSGSQRFVTVADIDLDGDAELIVSHTNGLGGSTEVWTGTADHPLPAAPSYRSQWLFQEADFAADGVVATNPVPHWLQPGRNGQHLVTPEPDPRIGTTDTFTYAAQDGALASGPATVTLDILPAGNPPRFLSQPDTLTTRGFDYLYRPIVLDPDIGDAVTFQLQGGPDGMTVDPATGEVRWRPEALGDFDVTLLALDTIGFAIQQSYVLTVGDPVVVPDVVGQLEATAEGLLTTANLEVGRRTTATDPAIPAGVIAAQSPIAGSVAELGAAVDLTVSLGPAPEDVDDDSDGFPEAVGDCDDGNGAVHPGAADEAGDGIDQDCDGFDGSEPPVEIVVEPATLTLLAGESVQLTAYAMFADGTSQIATGLVTWASGNEGTATVSPAGRVAAVAGAGAGAGAATITATRGAVSGSTVVTVVDLDATDEDAPTVEIVSPADGESVFGTVDVLGTAADPELVRYELAISPAGEETWTPIGGGTAPVLAGVLGELDPTLMLNGLYTLRLTVLDAGGNQVVDEVIVLVEGNQKVGNFTLSFTDLTVPVAGLPITVTRTYDSRHRRRGDFGIGWRLGVQTLELSCTSPLGDGWFVGKSGLVFFLAPTRPHTCSLTLPDGEVEVFDFTPSPTNSPIVPFPFASIHAAFTPRAETLGELVVLGDSVLSILDPQPGPVSLVTAAGAAYAPERFRYRRADGTSIVFDADGVESIADPNGNELVFDASGISHSSGKSVSFTRDAEGRIIALTDPLGNSQTYRYSAAGDLVSHTDAVGNTTRFFYDVVHGLLRIEDPLGRPLARNEYDDEGRLIATTSASGRTITFSHDVDGRTETITEEDGAITVMEYDLEGNVLKVTDALGGETIHTYDADGNRTSTTNPEGETVTRTFDGRRNLTSVTDPLGNTTTYTYSAGDRVASITDPLGHTTSFVYDSRGNLLSRVNALGVVELSKSYDAAGNVVATSDALGNTTQLDFDDFGNLLSITDPRGHASTLTYDAAGNPISETDPRGSTVTTTYDARQLFTSKTNELGNTTSFGYTVAGKIASATGPLGHRVERTLDAEGRLVARVDALGNAATYVYAADGTLSQVIDARGEATTFLYDLLDRRVETRYADGSTTKTGYDRAGRVIETTDGAGNTTRFEYDAAGRVIETIDPLGNRFTREFDDAGRVISITDGLHRTTSFAYDELGRNLETTFADGTTRSETYDAAGNRTSLTDELGRVTSFAYDAAGNLIRVTDALGNETHYARDEDGNLVSQTDGTGATTAFVYDVNGRLTTTIFPDGGVERRSYDAANNVAGIVDPTGTTLDITYDSAGQMLSKAFSDGSSSHFTYSPTGNLLTASNGAGTVTFTYDDRDRISTVARPEGSLGYTYDAAGDLTSITVSRVGAPARVVSYGYDATRRLQTITEAPGLVSTYGYDAAGQLTSLARPNGAATDYAYDLRGRPTEILHRNAGGNLARFAYSRNAVGDVVSATELAGATASYQYDALRRLERETHASAAGDLVADLGATYDAVGNQLTSEDFLAGTTVDYSYDGAHRLLAAGAATFSYDEEGKLLTRSEAGSTLGFVWNAEDQLVEVSTSAGLVDFRYDALGHRVGRGGPGGSTDYLVDLLNPTGFSQVLAEIESATGTELARYVFGHQALSQSRGGERSYFHFDAPGSTRILSDAGGHLAASFSYDAFGELTGSSGTEPSDLLFKGEWFEPEIGLTFLRARWYDPGVGRFVSHDPIRGLLGEPLSLNPYLFANANPLVYSDPSGELSSLAIATIGSVVLSVGLSLGISYYVCGGQIQEAGRCSPGHIILDATVSGLLGAAVPGANAVLAERILVTSIAKAGASVAVKTLGLRGVMAVVLAVPNTVGTYLKIRALRGSYPGAAETTALYFFNVVLQYLVAGAGLRELDDALAQAHFIVSKATGPVTVQTIAAGNAGAKAAGLAKVYVTDLLTSGGLYNPAVHVTGFNAVVKPGFKQFWSLIGSISDRVGTKVPQLAVALF